MIEDKTLLESFQRGLIPGPAESEEAFLLRIKKAQPLFHVEWKDVTSPFGFVIDWVPISYSNKQIAWWEGAATWISEDQLPQIQLRKKFQNGSFLGYQRSDVLAHEAVHAARMCFEEPQFEEILAYATSSQAWKRFLGPLFNRTWQPLLLILAMVAGIFWPLIPLVFIGFSLGWLNYKQSIYRRCCRRFSLSFVLCLTDAEMRKFAEMDEKELISYLENSSTLLSRLKRLLMNSHL